MEGEGPVLSKIAQKVIDQLVNGKDVTPTEIALVVEDAQNLSQTQIGALITALYMRWKRDKAM